MAFAEEKRNFVLKFLDKSVKSESLEELKYQLNDLLIRDTIGGKLYKYHSFDENGYALESLKNGTMHCSKPDAFNDPFDCKIGITIQSLVEEVFGLEINRINAIIEKWGRVISNEVQIEDCSSYEQIILKKILSNQYLLKLVKDIAKTDEKMLLELRKKDSFFIEIARVLIDEENFSKEFAVCEDMLLNYMTKITNEGLRIFEKDNITFKDSVRAVGIKNDADEVQLMLLLVEMLCNDSKIKEETKKIIDSIDCNVCGILNDLFRIGCLGTDYKNRLMWSHYADSYTGFCVEYDFSEIDSESLVQLPLPVIYTENRPLVTWKTGVENKTDFVKQYMLSILTKDSIWEYENEWRIVIDAKELAEIKMPKVSCIYLGVFISADNRMKILEVAKELNIPVKQMNIDRGMYELHAEDISV